MVKALKRPTRKNNKKKFKKGKYTSRKKVGGDNSGNNSNNSNNNNVVIGTYNMSFYGDKGFDERDKNTPGISEYAFQSMTLNLKNPRIFWENANKHLKKFIENENPAMVGLQEMNDTISYIELLKNWNDRNEEGTEANRILKHFIDKFDTYGTIHHSFIKHNETISKEETISKNRFGFNKKSEESEESEELEKLKKYEKIIKEFGVNSSNYSGDYKFNKLVKYYQVKRYAQEIEKLFEGYNHTPDYEYVFGNVLYSFFLIRNVLDTACLFKKKSSTLSFDYNKTEQKYKTRLIADKNIQEFINKFEKETIKKFPEVHELSDDRKEFVKMMYELDKNPNYKNKNFIDEYIYSNEDNYKDYTKFGNLEEFIKLNSNTESDNYKSFNKIPDEVEDVFPGIFKNINAVTIDLDNEETRNKIIDILKYHGTQKIKDDLQLINKKNNKNYAIAHDFAEVNEAGSAIIYDENVFGNKIDGKQKLVDLGFGRPALFVLTEKNNEYNLLINAHGDQRAPLMNKKEEDLPVRIGKFNKEQIKINKEGIEEKANEFIDGKSINQIFITGDFNDRYDAIRDFSINGKLVTQKKPVRACCYNYDSTGVMGNAGENSNKNSNKDSNKDSTLKEYTNDEKEKYYFNERPSSKEPIPNNGGKIEEYLNFGDKVFGLKPISDMKIYNADLDEVSDKSDHELVFGEFLLNNPNSEKNTSQTVVATKMQFGGKRRNKRKTSKKPKKSKKSRKSKKRSTYRKRR